MFASTNNVINLSDHPKQIRVKNKLVGELPFVAFMQRLRCWSTSASPFFNVTFKTKTK